MYSGELSHMENSRRWSCINLIFVLALVIFNTANGYFRYYYIMCRVAAWEANGSEMPECKRGPGANFKPVWYSITECLGQVADTVIPCMLLWFALKKMQNS